MADKETFCMALRQESKQATTEHCMQVHLVIDKVIELLMKQQLAHDRSKFEDPELSLFAKYGPKLSQTEYGSDEYKRYLVEMGKALQHHYEHNRHHPEHFGDAGVSGMNLIDVIEMLCDWIAATKRMKDGDIRKSLKINAKRFGIDEQLASILTNTVELMDEEPVGDVLVVSNRENQHLVVNDREEYLETEDDS